MPEWLDLDWPVSEMEPEIAGEALLTKYVAMSRLGSCPLRPLHNLREEHGLKWPLQSCRFQSASLEARLKFHTFISLCCWGFFLMWLIVPLAGWQYIQKMDTTLSCLQDCKVLPGWFLFASVGRTSLSVPNVCLFARTLGSRGSPVSSQSSSWTLP